MPVNFDRLYADPDPAYLVSVLALVNEVEEARARIYAEAEAQAKLQGG